MIGPVTKIDPATLPQSNNIHYLGQISYNQIPGAMADMDVALMPFALNEATRCRKRFAQVGLSRVLSARLAFNGPAGRLHFAYGAPLAFRRWRLVPPRCSLTSPTRRL